MATNLLKPLAVQNTKPTDKDQRLSDGGGLYLLIKPNGAKWWRFDYSIASKRKSLSLGVYPVTSLADARRKAEDARKQVSNGIDPSEIRKQAKQVQLNEMENTRRKAQGLPIENSFKHVAALWLQSVKHLTLETTQKEKTSRLERLVFPLIGDEHIADVKSKDVLDVLKPLIDKDKLGTAHRLHSEMSAVFAYAIVHGFTDYDPAQPVAKQIPAQKVKHRAAIIDPKQVGLLLRDIAHYEGTFVVQQALKLSPMLFQRPGEIRRMEWKDVDLQACEWRPYITKTAFHHIVPLATQAISILEAIQPLTGSGKFVFPSYRRNNDKPLSENTIISALKSMGYTSDVMTAHGFRTTASTLLNEQGWSADAIERQLGHMPRDAVRAAYNRAQYLDERRRMMQAWADYLDSLKSGAQVIGIRNGTV